MVEFSKDHSKLEKMNKLREKKKKIAEELKKIREKQKELEETEEEIQNLEEETFTDIVRKRTEEELRLAEEMEEQRKKLQDELNKIDEEEEKGLEEQIEENYEEEKAREVQNQFPEKQYEGAMSEAVGFDPVYRLTQLTYKGEWNEKDKEDYNSIKETLDELQGNDTGMQTVSDDALDDIDPTKRVLKAMGYKREKLGFKPDYVI